MSGGLLPVELRDLEAVLRKQSADRSLAVKSFEADSLLQPGENYGSTIFRVHVLLVKNGDAEEELNLVAKMQPATAFQRKVFDSSFTFKKEIFMYETLVPAYQRLERELGVSEDAVFDILPKFYGARLLMESEGADDDCDYESIEIDDDAVILMQNLKVQGYYMADRHNGMDLEHGKAALSAMSRFHALGMALKHHRPDFFEIVKLRAKCLKFADVSFEEQTNYFLRLFRDDPVISPHYQRLEAAMRQETATTWTAVPPEPWSTIVHADFWVNNIMFHKDRRTGRVDDVKFVDFQNFLFLSPLRELVFFLTTSLRTDVMDRHFDELLDFYHASFVDVLARMKCDTAPFARDKFDERLNIDAFEEFPHCPFMLKIMTTEVEKSAGETANAANIMMNLSVSEDGLKRLRKLVTKFADKGWLGD